MTLYSWSVEWTNKHEWFIIVYSLCSGIPILWRCEKVVRHRAYNTAAWHYFFPIIKRSWWPFDGICIPVPSQNLYFQRIMPWPISGQWFQEIDCCWYCWNFLFINNLVLLAIFLSLHHLIVSISTNCLRYRKLSFSDKSSTLWITDKHYNSLDIYYH